MSHNRSQIVTKNTAEWFKNFAYFRPKSKRREFYKIRFPKKRFNEDEKMDRLQKLISKIRDRREKCQFKKPFLPQKSSKQRQILKKQFENEATFLRRIIRKANELRSEYQSRSKINEEIISSKINLSSKNSAAESVATEPFSLNSEVFHSDLDDTRKKMYSLQCVQRKLRTISSETSNSSTITSSKNNNTKTKVQKRSDEDSGVVSEVPFFDDTNEPQLINDRSTLTAENLHQLNAWRRVCAYENDQENQHSGSDDPAEEWNETVINWRNGTLSVEPLTKKLQPKNNSSAKNSCSFVKRQKPPLDELERLQQPSTSNFRLPLEQQPSTSNFCVPPPEQQPSTSTSNFVPPLETRSKIERRMARKSIPHGNSSKVDEIKTSGAILNGNISKVCEIEGAKGDKNAADLKSVKNVTVSCTVDATVEMLQFIDDIELKWKQKSRRKVRKRISSSDENDDDSLCVVDIL